MARERKKKIKNKTREVGGRASGGLTVGSGNSSRSFSRATEFWVFLFRLFAFQRLLLTYGNGIPGAYHM